MFFLFSFTGQTESLDTSNDIQKENGTGCSNGEQEKQDLDRESENDLFECFLQLLSL